jgi:hypothetical protein
MYAKAQPIYYGLATLVVSTALFLAVPFNQPEVLTIQKDMVERLSIGWQQTMGDKPWFSEVSFIFDATNDFYTQAAAVTYISLSDPEATAEINYVYGRVYQIFAQSFTKNSTLAENALPMPKIGEDFMTEEPLYNLIPYREVVKTIETPTVAGVATVGPWNTITDAITGQSYCLAIYNGEVNQYLGTCASQGYY